MDGDGGSRGLRCYNGRHWLNSSAGGKIGDRIPIMQPLTTPSPWQPSGISLGIALLFWGMMVIALWPASLPAQNPNNGNQKEEKRENQVKSEASQKKKLPAVEQYESAPPKRRTPIRVGDEEMDDNPAPGKDGEGWSTGLDTDAERA